MNREPTAGFAPKLEPVCGLRNESWQVIAADAVDIRFAHFAKRPPRKGKLQLQAVKQAKAPLLAEPGVI